MRSLRFIAINASFGAVLYFGLFGGQEWCWNICRFLIWICCPFAVAVLVVRDAPDMRDTLIEFSKPPVPAIIELTFDWTVTIALAATGHFVYAALWAVSLCAQSGYRSHGRKLAKESQA